MIRAGLDLHERHAERVQQVYHDGDQWARSVPDAQDKRDPAVDAVKAIARAYERHNDLYDAWETKGCPGGHEPPEIKEALENWRGLHLTLAQTPATTVWGALAKAEIFAELAERGEALHHAEICRSIRDDVARLRKEADHG